MESRGQLKNGKRHGLWRFPGLNNEYCVYKNGVQHGRVTWFWKRDAMEFSFCWFDKEYGQNLEYTDGRRG